jgi:eukaryotic-like serine/threonine-protein kinase
MTLPPGSRLGRFEITGVLGEGSMGTVYLGHDPQIERPVAVKTLRRDAGSEQASEIASRFVTEAKIAGRLQHPNIVTIYEAGQDQGVDFIAMEYVDGDPLNRRMSDPDFSLSERVRVVRQAASALEHAHERGVLHRDIKPGNILVTRDGHVKVADFGIGKLLEGAGDLTRTGQLLGSPAYMSPEQVRGEKLDGRSDFFSLAVVFYELLTGSRPFPGDTITTLVYQILHVEPRDPLKLRADLPPSTRDVFTRLLAKSPAKRPATGKEFLREIGTIEKEIEAVHLQTRPLAAPAPAPSRRAAPERPAASAEQEESRVSEAEAARPRFSLVNYLLGVAALILAAAIVVVFLRRGSTAARTDAAPPAPTAAAAIVPTAAEASVAPLATPAGGEALPGRSSEPAATPMVLPTRGPREAADASVGAPRSGLETPRARRPTSAPRVARNEPVPAPPEPAEPLAPAGPPVDRVYRTRRFAKFSVSPDQARVFLDGRYIGIADDWDDYGGAKTLEVPREGSHRVRLELPGYRTINLELLATPSANDETVDIGDELKRESKADYPKIPKLDDRTVGPVEFNVTPPDAEISEGTRVLGPASSFGPGSPLTLSGPAVHDLTLTAPGHKPRRLRILVTSNAGREVAKIKLELKKE